MYDFYPEWGPAKFDTEQERNRRRLTVPPECWVDANGDAEGPDDN